MFDGRVTSFTKRRWSCSNSTPNRSESLKLRLKVDQPVLVDMSHVNELRYFHSYVVHKVLVLHISDMSSPSHIAPTMSATFDVDSSARRNDRLDLMVGSGARPQIQVRRSVSYCRICRQSGK